MKKIKISIIFFGTSFLLSNCVSIGIGAPDAFGFLYSDVTRSESLQTVVGPKEGKACQQSFLPLAAIGDNSLTSAAKSANITNIQSVSFKEQKVLMGVLYRKSCTIVTGN